MRQNQILTVETTKRIQCNVFKKILLFIKKCFNYIFIDSFLFQTEFYFLMVF